jgi:nucleoid-associated protein YgaU
MKWRGKAQLLALTVGTAFVLVTCRPRLGELAGGLRSPRQWVAEVGPDAAVSAVAGALLWLVALWLALGLIVTAASLLPGRLGRLGSAAAHRLTPVALRRLVAAATSTSILLSPATALATPSGGGSPAPAAATSIPAVGWPTDPGPASHPVPVPPASPSAQPDAERATGPDNAGLLRVGAGDSLWSIAAHRLGPTATRAQIQREWPRWYTANRPLIGPDPNLIRPGTSLRIPASSRPAPDSASGDTER